MEQPKPEQFKVRRKPVPLIVVADGVGYVQAFVTGFSLANGLWPSAVAAPGPLSRFLPFILCIGVTLCLGSVWKAIGHHIARTRSLFWGAVWLALAFLVWAAAIGTSGRYMAALVDGVGAIQEHEAVYLRELGGAVTASEERTALDRPLIEMAAQEARNLRGVQDGERRFGLVSKKPGDKGVTDVIGREADAFDALAGNLRDMDRRRVDYLSQADRSISEARGAAARGDEAGFMDTTTAAVRTLKEANAVSLLAGAGGFGAGMAVDAARAPFDQAKHEVDQFVSSAKERQREVVVPVFAPMSDKNAVMAYPPMAAWILAVTIESFPFFMVIALLISNLDGMKPTLSPAE